MMALSLDLNFATGKPATAKETPEQDSYVRHGDAYDLAADLEKDSLDLIITSPPYWGQRTYGLEHNWKTLDAWKAEGHDRAIPGYDWYRSHGGCSRT